MNKIKLNLDQLKVDSFETEEAKRVQGTVKANESYDCTIEGPFDTKDTCIDSCNGNVSCVNSCWHTCLISCDTCFANPCEAPLTEYE